MLSGMDAWSVFRSFLKTILPSCRTDDTTFNMAAVRKEEPIRHRRQQQDALEVWSLKGTGDPVQPTLFFLLKDSILSF